MKTADSDETYLDSLMAREGCDMDKTPGFRDSVLDLMATIGERPRGGDLHSMHLAYQAGSAGHPELCGVRRRSAACRCRCQAAGEGVPMTARLRKCPKCGSPNVDWVETTDAHSTFRQNHVGIDPEGTHNYGLITGVMGLCRVCKHTWKPRNASMVTQLPGHPDYAPKARPLPAKVTT